MVCRLGIKGTLYTPDEFWFEISFIPSLDGCSDLGRTSRALLRLVGFSPVLHDIQIYLGPVLLIRMDWRAALRLCTKGSSTTAGESINPIAKSRVLPDRGSLYGLFVRLSAPATPLSMPRKPQPLRRSRCSLRSSQLAPSGRSLIAVPESETQTSESFALASLTSQGVPRSGCPFQSRPGVVAGHRSRRLVGRRGASAVARASNACEGGRRRGGAVPAPAEAGEGRGLR